MKVLVTGGTGIIGRYLLRKIKPHAKAVATYYLNKDSERISDVEYHRLDIARKKDVIELFTVIKPDVVVHIASIGSVDFCEEHRDEAWMVNVDGTKNMIEGAQTCQARFIFISSNAVFDGKTPPYDEEDLPSPVNFYGKLKLEGEEAIASSGLEYAIVRPILIYGWNDPSERSNPVTWLLSKLKDNKPVKIVNDIYCNPLLANNCADAIWSVIINRKKGIYHVGGKDRLSRFDFAVKTAKAFGMDHKLIESVPNAYFKNIAPRPKDTTYSTKKMQRKLGIRPIGIDEGLDIMLSEKELVLWQG